MVFARTFSGLKMDLPRGDFKIELISFVFVDLSSFKVLDKVILYM